MKRSLLWITLATALSISSFSLAADRKESATSPSALTSLQPEAEQAQAALISAQFLTRYHYKTQPLDDAMSSKIFTRYLKSLDPEKVFFVQSDISQFETVRTKLDDAIILRDIRSPFAIFNAYQKRFSERFSYARSLLKNGFDFKQDESYQFDRENANWATSDAEINDIWRKRVKNDWLRLKLAGKNEKAIRETLDKRYAGYLSRNAKLSSEDVFQTFMNAYALAIDPHTSYFGPRAAEDFDISMKLSLTGIGAVLQLKDEYTVVREVVPGGPAALSGKIKVGDRILGVAQGANGPFTEVLGWRIDDTVKLIRGASDSIVRLDILPEEAGVDGKHVQISLVRKKIKLEEQAAKKSVIQINDSGVNRKIGVVSLPTFYLDVEAKTKGDKDYRSATRDVERLLGELKAEKVDAVLVDLRNNGGGSLTEAVDLTGLFIDKGPVVQQRNAKGEVEVSSDTRAGFAWDGPLGVLINRGSASASEIFAAAIQDYGRGIIIGETSFGKGTVQTLVDLNRFAPNPKDQLGELKLTIAQFFRINGGTTQLRGVVPDIAFPLETDTKNFGESSYDNALPWTSIKPADYTPTGDLKDLQPLLQIKEEQRLANNKEFQFLQEDLAELQKKRKEGSISLNEDVRRQERDDVEKRIKKREEVLADKNKNGKSAKENYRQDDGLQADERSLSAELKAEKERKEAKDILLNEAAQILADEVSLLKTNTKLAERVLPRAALPMK